jgi:Holliday junction DNA helicase RuvA
MISLVHGLVRSLTLDKAIVELNGIGLSVSITASTSATLNVGAPVSFFTTLVVREESLTLFGFLDDESRTLFEMLQTVTGIGPKVSLAILNVLRPDELGRAVASEDVDALAKVPGIGRKGAQRLILELKGKIADLSVGAKVSHHQPVWREQLASALISLGFSAKEADGAISQVVNTLAQDGIDSQSQELSVLLKLALQNGGRA